MNYALRFWLLLCFCISLQPSTYAVKSAPTPAAPTEKIQEDKRIRKQLRKQRRLERKKARKALRKQLRQLQRQSKDRTLGFLALVLSLGSIFLFYLGAALSSSLFSWLGVFLIPTVLVISIIALRKIKKHPEKYEGKWMALAGFIYSGGMIALMIFTIYILLTLGN